eukprot:3862184-Rhodomonas_salina.1
MSSDTHRIHQLKEKFPLVSRPLIEAHVSLVDSNYKDAKTKEEQVKIVEANAEARRAIWRAIRQAVGLTVVTDE